MTRPTISNQISIGNIIQIGAFVVAVVAAYYAIQYQAETASIAASKNTEQIASLEGRIRDLENRSARDSEQLRTLQRDIQEIKEGQREINSLLRQLPQRGAIDTR